VVGNAREVQSKEAGRNQAGPSFRLSTGVKNDPEFQVNQAKFFGAPTEPDKEYYKNYRNFYRGCTPQVG